MVDQTKHTNFLKLFLKIEITFNITFLHNWHIMLYNCFWRLWVDTCSCLRELCLLFLLYSIHILNVIFGSGQSSPLQRICKDIWNLIGCLLSAQRIFLVTTILMIQFPSARNDIILVNCVTEMKMLRWMLILKKLLFIIMNDEI